MVLSYIQKPWHSSIFTNKTNLHELKKFDLKKNYFKNLFDSSSKNNLISSTEYFLPNCI